MKTAGLILAAGMSSRMGSFKPLIELNGKKMIDWTIENMLQGGAEKVIVVIGNKRAQMQRWLLKYDISLVQPVFNGDFASGEILDSIKCGVRELKRQEFERFFLLLADLPAVSVNTFERLSKVYDQCGKKIAIASVHGKRRHPQLISMEMAEHILDYEGKGGLRGFWRYVEGEIADVKINDPGCEMDADTPEDLICLKSYMQKIKKKGKPVE
ncbi:molybdopterin-guanine dinucleotide biosynthesis protein MobA [uncultured Roseburia sp.]|uniref:Nucleotidyltransferase family protein n=1 Tax=Brotonthovivens ammoniilytica TaxID=2981725 RepID=A0ABT2TMV9_9FIRM|nr:nucleotidyltransferase family protein [Brotonthovivens ammoniilytica]MCU6763558.1 nucleotidyltransferase family protein [Brotonthovivens ammoniilytica]SCJ24983.1 molybdopterin-guanine dinucleotide biosynthesis protein MobA [uncultured Roseburia sp.]